MEVSQVMDHITHAVIGGHQTINMGISDSPEFFNILSSTLYTDQKLAVVRETICNAWDAHIEAGMQNVPIQITLMDNTLIIRDFGSGIHHNDIGPVYGVYGNSTKKNDGKQTGGFGLGCKSPFAYVDNFQVKSMHQGVMTIYSISKSSAEVNGKPGIVPITSVPTTESGLEVSIEIKSKDVSDFIDRIKTVLFNGGIKAIFNGNEYEHQLQLGTEPHSFVVTPANQFGYKDKNVYVRYGNVVYPIPNQGETNSLLQSCSSILDSLWHSAVGSHKRALVLQAEPNTISVTPSREALSMQAKTIKTVTNLMSKFIVDAEANFTKNSLPLVMQDLDHVLNHGDPWDAVRWPQSMHFRNHQEMAGTFINDYAILSRARLYQSYPKFDDATRIKILKRALTAVAELTIRPVNTKKFIKRVHNTFDEFKQDLMRNVILTPIMREFKGAGLNLKNLDLMDKYKEFKHYDYNERDKVYFIPLWNVEFLDHNMAGSLNVFMKLLKPTAVVATSQTITEKMYTSKLSYILSRKTVEREKEILALKGMKQWDITIKEPVKVVRAAPGTKKKAVKKVGYASALNVIDGNKIDMRWHYAEGATRRVEDPKWYHFTSKGQANSRKRQVLIDSPMASVYLMANWAEYGAIVNTGPQKIGVENKNIPNQDEFFVQRFYAEIMKHPKIILRHLADEYIENHEYEYAEMFSHNAVKVTMYLMNFDAFHEKIGTGLELTKYEKELYTILRERASIARWHQTHDEEIILNRLNKIPMPPEVKRAMGIVNKQPWMQFVNVNNIESQCTTNKSVAELLNCFV